MDQRTIWLARLQRRLRWGLFMKWAVKYLAIGLFVCGTVVLLLKLVSPGTWPHSLWILLINIPLLLRAWTVSYQEVYSHQDAIAMLDSKIGAGGLLMSLDELPDAVWTGQLETQEEKWRQAIPRMRWQRALKTQLAPVAFLLAACFIPERTLAEITMQRPQVAQQEIQKLEDALSQLEAQQWITQEEQEELREEVRKLADETRRQNLTHETWENVDTIKQRMQQVIGSQRMQMSKAAGALATLQDAIDSGKTLSAERQAEIEAQLEDILKQKGLTNAISKEVLERLKQNLKDGQFNAAQSQQDLQQAMEEFRDFMEQQGIELDRALEGMEGVPRFDGEFDWEGGEGEGESAGEPGAGGLGRGRGDADMGWGEESDKQGIKFKDTLLPEGVADPNDDVIRITLTEPDAEPVAPEGRSAPRQATDATGNNAWKRNLRPRHREIIRKYFDKQE